MILVIIFKTSDAAGVGDAIRDARHGIGCQHTVGDGITVHMVTKRLKIVDRGPINSET